MSGGNIDMRLLSNVILRELTREGRIILLALQIEDRPGQLAEIAAHHRRCAAAMCWKSPTTA